ncbi:MAG: HD domain-containing protein [Propionivibrio sp.]|uniref:HD-GYP domain-containing protein n=1 Tax=Propionivibrio sp. TaxID=2212460 RepID=UPI001A44C63F|nr:HD domain-containing phosphohydrolase [Propionivibrio sp.]MBL8416080.1 HD domain-containing protein [Propionivibrio sp.]
MSPVHNEPIDKTLQLAQQLHEENKHFVKAVTDIAEQREVVAREDIYARNGMKLVSSGTRLTGKSYERLIAHKLLKPIEQSLSMADTLDCARLVSLCFEETRLVPSLAPLLDQPGPLERLQLVFGDLRLPAPLTLKLSVMQQDRPQLFQHGLITAMISTVLGIRGKLPRQDLQTLALASIFHDVGELCIDPAILRPEHRLTAEERRHLYTHPITGYLMLRDFPEIPPETATAVLQHHERLDASGYPYRFSGEQIGTVSRYLAVAEVAATLLARDGADKRISMKLRLNRKKYDAQAVTLVSQLFSDSKLPPAQPPEEVVMMTRLAQAGKLFEDWIGLRKTLTPADVSAVPFIIERVDGLRMMLLETGFDPCRLEDALTMTGSDDPEIVLEQTVLIDELEWQFKALSREVERKLFGRETKLPSGLNNCFDDWLIKVRQFVSE